MVGFMGCYAAINALKLAHHIVRSTPQSRVLVVNVELCTLHLRQTSDMEQMLSFLVFGDGCAASIVSADPTGLALDRFHATLLPDTHELISWRVQDSGFEMFLSGRVPGAIARGLERASGEILDGARPDAVDVWAAHPGGRSVLDAVEHGLRLAPSSLGHSRGVLKSFGNMSSATVMFVLRSVLEAATPGQHGCALSFGPGLTAETMLFHKA
jgi:predicted naringenin-chalcone synthase